MSGHLDESLLGPPDPPYIEGDLGAPSRAEWEARRGVVPADPGTPERLREKRLRVRFSVYDGAGWHTYTDDVDGLAWKAVAALEAREQQIQKALAFYADEHRWCDPDVRTCGCRFTEFCDDVANGEHPSSVARAALREIRPEGTDA